MKQYLILLVRPMELERRFQVLILVRRLSSLIFQLGEAKQEDIANTKKIHVNFKACYAYSASDEVKAAPVVPIVDVTPTPVPTTPQETPAPTPGNTATPTATPDTNSKKVIPISKKTNKANVVKKIKATKKTVVTKKKSQESNLS